MACLRVSRRTVLAAAAGALAGSLSNTIAATGDPMHIVLLGDSSFDNAPYVARGEEVIATLTERLPAGWRATLNARDGAVTRDVQGQLRGLPEDATHLIVSVGGNDALGASGVLQEPARSVAESLDRLARIREAFAEEYRAMIALVLQRNLPVAISTIYEARFSEPPMRRIAATALTVLNDLITREASSRGLPVIDLRTMFNEDADYANAIEPSARGSEKIAAAILSLVGQHDFAMGRSTMYVR